MAILASMQITHMINTGQNVFEHINNIFSSVLKSFHSLFITSSDLPIFAAKAIKQLQVLPEVICSVLSSSIPPLFRQQTKNPVIVLVAF